MAKRFISEGKTVKGSTTSHNKIQEFKAIGIDPYIIDLKEEKSLNQLPGFLKSQHLVIAVPPRVKDQNDFRGQIERIIPYIKKSKVEYVVFISSTSVYPNTNGVITEEFNGIPDSPSGKVLLEAEQLLSKCPGFETTILRMAGLYGYDRQPGKFLVKKKKLSNGKGVVNLIHQDDCIGIICKITDKEIWGEVFNCCSDEHPIKKEFYTKAALHLGLQSPEFVQDHQEEYKIIANNKLKRALGYQFKYPNPMELI